jgi:hypothetical protein
MFINSSSYYISSSSTTGSNASAASASTSTPAAQLDAMHQQHLQLQTKSFPAAKLENFAILISSSTTGAFA